jgi:DNA segregation ATPase FtsK/SpoIIIE, S-DNA-T family
MAATTSTRRTRRPGNRPAAQRRRPARTTRRPRKRLGRATAQACKTTWMGAASGTGWLVRRSIRAVGVPATEAATDDRQARRDGTGLALVLVGALLIIGGWFHLHAPLVSSLAGGLTFLVAGLIGMFVLPMPVLLVALAVELMRGSRGTRLRRQLVGGALLTAGATGLLDLLAGSGGHHSLPVHTGGALGYVCGLLAALVTPWVAVPLLLLLAGAGAVVASGVPADRLRTRLATLAGRRDADVEDEGDDYDDDDPDDHDPDLSLEDASPQTRDAQDDGASEDDPHEVEHGPHDLDDETPRRGEPVPALPVPVRSVAVRAVGLQAAEQLLLVEDTGYQLPPLKLLKAGTRPRESSTVRREAAELQALFDEFKKDAKVVNTLVGPAVVRYEVIPGTGVSVKTIEKMADDIASRLAAVSVHVLAPVPGKRAVGVEVPRPDADRETVGLADVLRSPAATRDRHPLLVALGKSIDGRHIVANLAAMPHVLIAGATGSGKSAALNALLTSILTRATPEQVRLLLIDPKRVELISYTGIPHLTKPIISDLGQAAQALAWAVGEMEIRYDQLAEARVRNIDEYNAKVRAGRRPGPTMPYLLVVVDELGDLMLAAAQTNRKRRAEDEETLDVEENVVRLGQKARAAGVHMVLATQRPSVDVVTGLIKANVPSRIAFATASLADSRVILDEPGAEKLVGKGDGLYAPVSAPRPTRFQGALVTTAEVDAVVAHWRRQHQASRAPGGPTGRTSGMDLGKDDVDLLCQAAELVVSSQHGSAAMLQRKLRVSPTRADRLMGLLEGCRVVGPAEGSKARRVLMRDGELQPLLDALAGSDSAHV